MKEYNEGYISQGDVVYFQYGDNVLGMNDAFETEISGKYLNQKLGAGLVEQDKVTNVATNCFFQVFVDGKSPGEGLKVGEKMWFKHISSNLTLTATSKYQFDVKYQEISFEARNQSYLNQTFKIISDEYIQEGFNILNGTQIILESIGEVDKRLCVNKDKQLSLSSEKMIWNIIIFCKSADFLSDIKEVKAQNIISLHNYHQNAFLSVDNLEQQSVFKYLSPNKQTKLRLQKFLDSSIKEPYFTTIQTSTQVYKTLDAEQNLNILEGLFRIECQNAFDFNKIDSKVPFRLLNVHTGLYITYNMDSLVVIMDKQKSDLQLFVFEKIYQQGTTSKEQVCNQEGPVRDNEYVKIKHLKSNLYLKYRLQKFVLDQNVSGEDFYQVHLSD